MIKRINESKTFVKHIPCECRREFDDRNCNSKNKTEQCKCQCECKRPITHWKCEEEYVWNPSTCACECDKDCEIGEHLKECECTMSLVDDVLAICDEIVNTPESAVINSSNGINYWHIPVVLLAIGYLLRVMVIVVKYPIKPELTFPCLLAY